MFLFSMYIYGAICFFAGWYLKGKWELFKMQKRDEVEENGRLL